ncbi:MAG: FecR domain-containing protein [Pseudomonadota bacterium]
MLADERGHAVPDALREEARIWLGRLALAEVTQMDMQAFKRWQHTSAAHQAAFDEAKHQWHAMKLAIDEGLRADPKATARYRQLAQGTPHAAQQGRRAFLGAAMSAAAVAGVAVVAYPPLGLWPAPGAWGADERTATGEQRTLGFANHVRVTLNTQTRVRRETSGHGETTGIDLLAGEVAIDLQAMQEGASPSFVVTAGAGRSGAQGASRFQVRHLQGSKVCVTCIEGSVQVAHAAGHKLLQARQQTVYDATSLGGVQAIEPADLSAWRKGELVFRQTPLAQVLDEINRYRPGRVVLMADARRDSAVSGRFSIAVLDEALLQIQHSFDLRARALPGGLLILS